MRTYTLNEVKDKVHQYLDQAKYTHPYFVFVDQLEAYLALKSDLTLRTEQTICASQYCGEDTTPNWDHMLEDIQSSTCQNLILGVGEALYLSQENTNFLFHFINMYPAQKSVFLIRAWRKEVPKLEAIDHKFKEMRHYCVEESAGSFTLIQYDNQIQIPVDADGFQQLLQVLEQGEKDQITVKTAFPLVHCHHVSSYYDLLTKDPTSKFSSISKEKLSEKHWEEFYKDQNCNGYPLTHWRTFLQNILHPSNNPYMQRVMNASSNEDVYPQKILNTILDVDTDDLKFHTLYSARKELIDHQFTDSDIAVYVNQTSQRGEERIQYLTDQTRVERQTILEEIGKNHAIPENIGEIYPDLGAYLHSYAFTGKHGEELTEYFDQYKKQKVCNEIQPQFWDQVEALALDHSILNTLPSRNNVLLQYDSKKDALYWMDALGVEYLSYIQAKAKEKGIHLKIQIAAATMPTLTYINKDFFEQWEGYKNGTSGDKKLDDIKHGKDENASDGTYPTHLANELIVIDQAMENIKEYLSLNPGQRMILTSDHGATRLAVIAPGEEDDCHTVETIPGDMKGEHGGRCCPCDGLNPEDKPKYAVEQSNYWSMANYNRFPGTKKAKIEIHGGALLEEVIIPVIEFTLPQEKIYVKVTSKDPLHYDRTKGITPTLKLWCNLPVDTITVEITSPSNCKGKRYTAQQDPNQKQSYTFHLDDIKKSGPYDARVYADDSEINSIRFNVASTMAKANPSMGFFGF